MNLCIDWSSWPNWSGAHCFNLEHCFATMVVNRCFTFLIWRRCIIIYLVWEGGISWRLSLYRQVQYYLIFLEVDRFKGELRKIGDSWSLEKIGDYRDHRWGTDHKIHIYDKNEEISALHQGFRNIGRGLTFFYLVPIKKSHWILRSSCFLRFKSP